MNYSAINKEWMDLLIEGLLRPGNFSFRLKNPSTPQDIHISNEEWAEIRERQENGYKKT